MNANTVLLVVRLVNLAFTGYEMHANAKARMAALETRAREKIAAGEDFTDAELAAMGQETDDMLAEISAQTTQG